MRRSRILDNGQDTVIIYNDEAGADSYGNVVARPSAVGIVVRGCTMQPLRADRDKDGRTHYVHRLFTRSALLGPWSRVEWKGKSFHVIDGPHRHERVGRGGTDHYSAVLRESR